MKGEEGEEAEGDERRERKREGLRKRSIISGIVGYFRAWRKAPCCPSALASAANRVQAINRVSRPLFIQGCYRRSGYSMELL